MVVVFMSATTYQATIAALVMMDSIWPMMDTTVWVRRPLEHKDNDIVLRAAVIRSDGVRGISGTFLPCLEKHQPHLQCLQHRAEHLYLIYMNERLVCYKK